MINWESRFKNKQFLASMISLIVLIGKNTLGYDFFPADIDLIIDLILTAITSIGIIVDPSTGGWSDAIELSDPKDETIEVILDCLKVVTGEKLK